MKETKMGFWGRLFGKKQKDKPSDSAANIGQVVFNYSVLPEITSILTNQNESAIADISLLAREPEKFALEREEWFVGMDWDDSDWFKKKTHVATLNVFAYWLVGYEAVEDKSKNPPFQFGAYIDWKEAADEIIWNLSKAAKNLNDAVELEQIAFNGDESTPENLSKISEYLALNSYVLMSLDTDGDCYHLFIIEAKDYDRLTRLAAEANFKFFRNFT
jgi:hypothetical protein